MMPVTRYREAGYSVDLVDGYRVRPPPPTRSVELRINSSPEIDV